MESEMFLLEILKLNLHYICHTIRKYNLLCLTVCFYVVSKKKL